jgi:hypothetical protein
MIFTEAKSVEALVRDVLAMGAKATKADAILP